MPHAHVATQAAGGVPMLKALSGPYGDVRFIPTGGINAKNINSCVQPPSSGHNETYSQSLRHPLC